MQFKNIVSLVKYHERNLCVITAAVAIRQHSDDAKKVAEDAADIYSRIRSKAHEVATADTEIQTQAEAVLAEIRPGRWPPDGVGNFHVTGEQLEAAFGQPSGL